MSTDASKLTTYARQASYVQHNFPFLAPNPSDALDAVDLGDDMTSEQHVSRTVSAYELRPPSKFGMLAGRPFANLSPIQGDAEKRGAVVTGGFIFTDPDKTAVIQDIEALEQAKTYLNSVLLTMRWEKQARSKEGWDGALADNLRILTFASETQKRMTKFPDRIAFRAVYLDPQTNKEHVQTKWQPVRIRMPGKNAASVKFEGALVPPALWKTATRETDKDVLAVRNMTGDHFKDAVVQYLDIRLDSADLDAVRKQCPPFQQLVDASKTATPFASDTLAGYSQHKLEHINNGRFGNDNSWIPGSKKINGLNFVGLRFKEPCRLHSVALGRDNTRAKNDRCGLVDLQYTTDPEVSQSTTNWVSLIKVQTVPESKTYPCGGQYATGVRAVVPDKPANEELCLDHLQVFGFVGTTSGTATTMPVWRLLETQVRIHGEELFTLAKDARTSSGSANHTDNNYAAVPLNCRALLELHEPIPGMQKAGVTKNALEKGVPQTFFLDADFQQGFTDFLQAEIKDPNDGNKVKAAGDIPFNLLSTNLNRKQVNFHPGANFPEQNELATAVVNAGTEALEKVASSEEKFNVKNARSVNRKRRILNMDDHDALETSQNDREKFGDFEVGGFAEGLEYAVLLDAVMEPVFDPLKTNIVGTENPPLTSNETVHTDGKTYKAKHFGAFEGNDAGYKLFNKKWDPDDLYGNRGIMKASMLRWNPGPDLNLWEQANGIDVLSSGERRYAQYWQGNGTDLNGFPNPDPTAAQQNISAYTCPFTEFQYPDPVNLTGIELYLSSEPPVGHNIHEEKVTNVIVCAKGDQAAEKWTVLHEMSQETAPYGSMKKGVDITWTTNATTTTLLESKLPINSQGKTFTRFRVLYMDKGSHDHFASGHYAVSEIKLFTSPQGVEVTVPQKPLPYLRRVGVYQKAILERRWTRMEQGTGGSGTETGLLHDSLPDPNMPNKTPLAVSVTPDSDQVSVREEESQNFFQQLSHLFIPIPPAINVDDSSDQPANKDLLWTESEASCSAAALATTIVHGRYVLDPVGTSAVLTARGRASNPKFRGPTWAIYRPRNVNRRNVTLALCVLTKRITIFHAGVSCPAYDGWFTPGPRASRSFPNSPGNGFGFQVLNCDLQKGEQLSPTDFDISTARKLEQGNSNWRQATRFRPKPQFASIGSHLNDRITYGTDGCVRDLTSKGNAWKPQLGRAVDDGFQSDFEMMWPYGFNDVLHQDFKVQATLRNGQTATGKPLSRTLSDGSTKPFGPGNVGLFEYMQRNPQAFRVPPLRYVNFHQGYTSTYSEGSQELLPSKERIIGGTSGPPYHHADVWIEKINGYLKAENYRYTSSLGFTYKGASIWDRAGKANIRVPRFSARFQAAKTRYNYNYYEFWNKRYGKKDVTNVNPREYSPDGIAETTKHFITDRNVENGVTGIDGTVGSNAVWDGLTTGTTTFAKNWDDPANLGSLNVTKAEMEMSEWTAQVMVYHREAIRKRIFAGMGDVDKKELRIQQLKRIVHSDADSGDTNPFFLVGNHAFAAFNTEKYAVKPNLFYTRSSEWRTDAKQPPTASMAFDHGGPLSEHNFGLHIQGHNRGPTLTSNWFRIRPEQRYKAGSFWPEQCRSEDTPELTEVIMYGGNPVLGGGRRFWEPSETGSSWGFATVRFDAYWRGHRGSVMDRNHLFGGDSSAPTEADSKHIDSKGIRWCDSTFNENGQQRVYPPGKNLSTNLNMYTSTNGRLPLGHEKFGGSSDTENYRYKYRDSRNNGLFFQLSKYLHVSRSEKPTDKDPIGNWELRSGVQDLGFQIPLRNGFDPTRRDVSTFYDPSKSVIPSYQNTLENAINLMIQEESTKDPNKSRMSLFFGRGGDFGDNTESGTSKWDVNKTNVFLDLDGDRKKLQAVSVWHGGGSDDSEHMDNRAYNGNSIVGNKNLVTRRLYASEHVVPQGWLASHASTQWANNIYNRNVEFPGNWFCHHLHETLYRFMSGGAMTGVWPKTVKEKDDLGVNVENLNNYGAGLVSSAVYCTFTPENDAKYHKRGGEKYNRNLVNNWDLGFTGKYGKGGNMQPTGQQIPTDALLEGENPTYDKRQHAKIRIGPADADAWKVRGQPSRLALPDLNLKPNFPFFSVDQALDKEYVNHFSRMTSAQAPCFFGSILCEFDPDRQRLVKPNDQNGQANDQKVTATVAQDVSAAFLRGENGKGRFFGSRKGLDASYTVQPEDLEKVEAARSFGPSMDPVKGVNSSILLSWREASRGGDAAQLPYRSWYPEQAPFNGNVSTLKLTMKQAAYPNWFNLQYEPCHVQHRTTRGWKHWKDQKDEQQRLKGVFYNNETKILTVFAPVITLRCTEDAVIKPGSAQPRSEQRSGTSVKEIKFYSHTAGSNDYAPGRGLNSVIVILKGYGPSYVPDRLRDNLPNGISGYVAVADNFGDMNQDSFVVGKDTLHTIQFSHSYPNVYEIQICFLKKRASPNVNHIHIKSLEVIADDEDGKRPSYSVTHMWRQHSAKSYYDANYEFWNSTSDRSKIEWNCMGTHGWASKPRYTQAAGTSYVSPYYWDWLGHIEMLNLRQGVDFGERELQSSSVQFIHKRIGAVPYALEVRGFGEKQETEEEKAGEVVAWFACDKGFREYVTTNSHIQHNISLRPVPGRRWTRYKTFQIGVHQSAYPQEKTGFASEAEPWQSKTKLRNPKETTWPDPFDAPCAGGMNRVAGSTTTRKFFDTTMNKAVDQHYLVSEAAEGYNQGVPKNRGKYWGHTMGFENARQLEDHKVHANPALECFSKRFNAEWTKERFDSTRMGGFSQIRFGVRGVKPKDGSWRMGDNHDQQADQVHCPLLQSAYDFWGGELLSFRPGPVTYSQGPSRRTRDTVGPQTVNVPRHGVDANVDDEPSYWHQNFKNVYIETDPFVGSIFPAKVPTGSETKLEADCLISSAHLRPGYLLPGQDADLYVVRAKTKDKSNPKQIAWRFMRQSDIGVDLLSMKLARVLGGTLTNNPTDPMRPSNDNEKGKWEAAYRISEALRKNPLQLPETTNHLLLQYLLFTCVLKYEKSANKKFSETFHSAAFPRQRNDQLPQDLPFESRDRKLSFEDGNEEDFWLLPGSESTANGKYGVVTGDTLQIVSKNCERFIRSWLCMENSATESQGWIRSQVQGKRSAARARLLRASPFFPYLSHQGLCPCFRDPYPTTESNRWKEDADFVKNFQNDEKLDTYFGENIVWWKNTISARQNAAKQAGVPVRGDLIQTEASWNKTLKKFQCYRDWCLDGNDPGDTSYPQNNRLGIQKRQYLSECGEESVSQFAVLVCKANFGKVNLKGDPRLEVVQNCSIDQKQTIIQDGSGNTVRSGNQQKYDVVKDVSGNVNPPVTGGGGNGNGTGSGTGSGAGSGAGSGGEGGTGSGGNDEAALAAARNQRATELGFPAGFGEQVFTEGYIQNQNLQQILKNLFSKSPGSFTEAEKADAETFLKRLFNRQGDSGGSSSSAWNSWSSAANLRTAINMEVAKEKEVGVDGTLADAVPKRGEGLILAVGSGVLFIVGCVSLIIFGKQGKLPMWFASRTKSVKGLLICLMALPLIAGVVFGSLLFEDYI